MGQAQITQIPVGNQANLCWSGVPGSQDQVTFWNQDINFFVYLGYQNNISAGGNNTLPVPPNASFQLPANRSVYVVGASSGIAPLVVIPSAGNMFRSLTQGLGALSIPSIFSPNYQPGVAGWSIKKDGSAEFNNLTIRGNEILPNGWLSNGDGTLTTKPGLFLYNGTPAAGNLVFSCVAAQFGAGSDKFNNNFVAGTATYDIVGNVAVSLSFGTLSYFTMTANPNAVFTPQGSSTLSQNIATALADNGFQISTYLQIVSALAQISNIAISAAGFAQIVNAVEGTSGATAYTIGQSLRINGGSILINSTTPIPIHTWTNVAPGNYLIRSRIRFTSAAAGVIQPMFVRYSGNATFTTSIFTNYIEEAATQTNQPGYLTTQNTDPFCPNLGNSLTFQFWAEGYINVTAPGGLVVFGRQGISAADETFTILPASLSVLQPAS